jgi:hypothetical protein
MSPKTVQAFWQESQLGSIGAFYKTSHYLPHRATREFYLTRVFLHSQGQKHPFADGSFAPLGDIRPIHFVMTSAISLKHAVMVWRRHALISLRHRPT